MSSSRFSIFFIYYFSLIIKFFITAVGYSRIAKKNVCLKLENISKSVFDINNAPESSFNVLIIFSTALSFQLYSKSITTNQNRKTRKSFFLMIYIHRCFSRELKCRCFFYRSRILQGENFCRRKGQNQKINAKHERNKIALSKLCHQKNYTTKG